MLTYDCEIWSFSQVDMPYLNLYQRNILRKIFKSVHEKGEWRVRYNERLFQLYKSLNITIKVCPKKEILLFFGLWYIKTEII